MYKFEMALGWMGKGKITIETGDFDVIEVLKDFINFQEEEGWIGAYEYSVINFEEDEDEFEDSEEETEESK